MKRNHIFLRTLVIAALVGLPALASFAATKVVTIGNYWFSPTNITINPGDTIVWSNIVLTAHDTTSSSGLWSSAQLAQNRTFSYTFTNAGNYPYICAVHIVAHPEQTGTVSVASSGNLPPSVLITNPPSGTVFTAPANVTMQASASDDVSVTNVQFLVGSTILANDTAAPYAATTNGLPAGSYTLTAIASDNAGAKATNSVSISVKNSPLPVTILSPTLSGNAFSFAFATQVGYTYSGQFTPSLNPVTWFTFTNLSGNGSVVGVTDFSLTNSERYYRVGAQ